MYFLLFFFAVLEQSDPGWNRPRPLVLINVGANSTAPLSFPPPQQSYFASLEALLSLNVALTEASTLKDAVLILQTLAFQRFSL